MNLLNFFIFNVTISTLYSYKQKSIKNQFILHYSFLFYQYRRKKQGELFPTQKYAIL